MITEIGEQLDHRHYRPIWSKRSRNKMILAIREEHAHRHLRIITWTQRLKNKMYIEIKERHYTRDLRTIWS